MPAGQADWALIKRRWEEGLTAPAIEKEITVDGKPAVSRQAILKRARKENWMQGIEAGRSLVNGSSAGSSVSLSLTSTEPRELASAWSPQIAVELAGMGKTAATAQAVERGLQAYAVGGNHAMAAAMAGVSPDAWLDWRNGCPQLPAAIEAVQAAKAAKHLERIDSAGKRGDWKADEALLKANPLTKADWQGEAKGSQGVAIQINFGAGMPAEAMKVIEG